jgi:glycogen debranching enzyme
MEMLARRDELLRQKREGQEQLVAEASSIRTPVASLDRIYDLQNVCLDMMTLELPGVGLGAVAGLPGFAWFFGCDTYYSVGGLLVSGQAQTAVDTLRILANYARTQRGRTPHEITPTGRLFNPGNAVESGEFATAVEHTYRWTGDRAFLEETYNVCREGIFDYLLGECAADGSFLPDGPGLLELSSAHRGKKLDVAVALYQGLGSLGYLAEAVGAAETVVRCVEVREKVRTAIERHFWQEERGEYVWRIEQDLSVRPDEPAHTYVMMEMAVLDGSDPRLNGLFETIEGPEHTGPKGVIHPGTTDFVMPIQNAILALAELQYGRADRGLWYLERMAELCGYNMPGAIPEFEAEQGTAKACFLQLWSSAAFNWLMVQGWFRLLPDPQQEVVWVRPQLPSGWDSTQVRNLTIWGKRYNLTLQRRGNSIDLDVEPLSGGEAHPFRLDPQPSLPAVFV